MTKKISIINEVYNIEMPKWTFIQKISANKKYYYASITFKKQDIILAELNEKQWKSYSEKIEDLYIDKIIINETGQIITIKKTNECPIPNLNFFEDRIEAFARPAIIRKTVLIEAIDNVITKENKYYDYITSNINSYFSHELSRDDVYNCFRMKKSDTESFTIKGFGDVVDYIYDKYDILINMNIKRQKHLVKLIPNFVNINYKRTGKNLKDVLYYLGKESTNNFNTNITNGFIIEEIININENDLEQYFNLMKIDLIKINSYSKYPYPFKYLREFIEILIFEDKINVK